MATLLLIIQVPSGTAACALTDGQGLHTRPVTSSTARNPLRINVRLTCAGLIWGPTQNTSYANLLRTCQRQNQLV